MNVLYKNLYATHVSNNFQLNNILVVCEVDCHEHEMQWLIKLGAAVKMP